MVSSIFFLSMMSILLGFLIAFIFVVPKYYKERDQINAYLQKKNASSEDKLTDLLAELSTCKDYGRIIEIIDSITEFCDDVFNHSTYPPLRKRAKTILLWLQHFSTEKHITEVRTHGSSSQIAYDRTTKKYRLTRIS